MACRQYAYYDRGSEHEFQCRSVTFYTAKYWHRHPSNLKGLTSAEDPVPFKAVPVCLMVPVRLRRHIELWLASMSRNGSFS